MPRAVDDLCLDAFPGVTNGERPLFLSTGNALAAANRLGGTTTEGAVPTSLAAATTNRFAAGTVIHAGCFQNSGGAMTIDVGFGASNHIALTWMRP
jgi:hypothetical protein